jgi:hypothetical protein
MPDVNPVSSVPVSEVNKTEVAVKAKETKAVVSEEMNTKVSDMGDLEKKAPEVYRAFEESIFRSFSKAEKDRQERIKKLLKNNGD